MITDPIKVVYSERHNIWVLQQGNETFYDENGYWITFNTKEEAEEYLIKIIKQGGIVMDLHELEDVITSLEKRNDELVKALNQLLNLIEEHGSRTLLAHANEILGIRQILIKNKKV